MCGQISPNARRKNNERRRRTYEQGNNSLVGEDAGCCCFCCSPVHSKRGGCSNDQASIRQAGRQANRQRSGRRSIRSTHVYVLVCSWTNLLYLSGQPRTVKKLNKEKQTEVQFLPSSCIILLGFQDMGRFSSHQVKYHIMVKRKARSKSMA